MNEDMFREAVDSIKVPQEKLDQLKFKKRSYNMYKYATICLLAVSFLTAGLWHSNQKNDYGFVTKVLAFDQTEMLNDHKVEIQLNKELLKEAFRFGYGYDEKLKDYKVECRLPFDIQFEGEDIERIDYRIKGQENLSLTLFKTFELDEKSMDEVHFKESESITFKSFDEYDEKIREVAKKKFGITSNDHRGQVIEKILNKTSHNDLSEVIDDETDSLFWLLERELKEIHIPYHQQSKDQMKMELYVNSRITEEENNKGDRQVFLKRTLESLENSLIDIQIHYKNGIVKEKQITFQSVDNYCVMVIQ